MTTTRAHEKDLQRIDAERMTRELRTPQGDVDRAALILESESPLFNRPAR